MTISLSQMIADLNAKIAAADSNTPIATVLQYVTEAERLGGGKIIYDSSGALPSDSAYEGMIAYVADSATLKVRGDYGWVGIADSASAAPIPWSFQGSTSGYITGGVPGLTDNAKTIQKYSFTSDGNATDVGDLSNRILNAGAGGSSLTDGYQISGGNPGQTTAVDKFPFATDTNATATNTHVAVQNSAFSSSEYAAYQVAGVNPWPGGFTTRISKYEFAADTSNTNVGDTATILFQSFACSSDTNLYAYGGRTPTYLTAIEKFPFTTEGTMTDVGDLTVARGGGTGLQGQNSNTHGYAAGGSPLSNVIDKFPFSTDGNATDVGDMTVSGWSRQGASSTASGYGAGGSTPSASNIIEKFPFSSDANATDVGDLIYSMVPMGGAQV